MIDHQTCLRISEQPEVDEALRLFAEGETSEEQAVSIVQAVLSAHLAAQQAEPDATIMELVEDYAKAVHDGDDAACQVLRRTISASLTQQAEPAPVVGEPSDEQIRKLAIERLRNRSRYELPDLSFAREVLSLCAASLQPAPLTDEKRALIIARATDKTADRAAAALYAICETERHYAPQVTQLVRAVPGVWEPAAWRWFNSNGDQVTDWSELKRGQRAMLEEQVAEAGGRIEYAYTHSASTTTQPAKDGA